MPARFFITHSWKDIQFARRLCDDLRANGLDGFFDAYSIKPGQNIAEKIEHGLETCDIYLPVLSFAALASPWCKEEITAAITMSNEPGRNGRPLIIPLLVENCQSEMPVLLRSRLYINFVGRYEQALPELLQQGIGVEAIQVPVSAGTLALAPEPMPATRQNDVPDSTATVADSRPLPFETALRSRTNEASYAGALLWVTTGAVIAYAISGIRILLEGYTLTSMGIGIVAGAAIYVGLFLLWEWVQYALARAMGGNGKLSEQMYLQSLCIAPFMIATQIVGLAPVGSALLLLLGVLLLYLLIISHRITHRLSSAKAALASVIPTAFALILFANMLGWFFFLPSGS